MTDNLTAQNEYEEGMAEFLNHNYEQSIEHLSRAIELDPDLTIALKSRGAAYLRLDKPQKALADFNAAVDMDPANARAFHLRGLAYEKTGENDKALADFGRALELNSDYGAVYYSRANLNNKMGRTEQAAEDIRMVTHLTEVNLETFSDANNVWRSQQLRLETMHNDDLAMER